MWAWYESSWTVVELESSFTKFFWSVCSKPTTSLKGAFSSKEKGCKSFWVPTILVGVVWAALHKTCLLCVRELSECKHFSNTCWSQPDVSDTHVTLCGRFLQAFASVGQKCLCCWLLRRIIWTFHTDIAAESSDCNSFPLLLLSGIYIQVPEFSMVCRKWGLLKHWTKIFTFLSMDLAIAKPMSISKSWGLNEQSNLEVIIGYIETR